MLNALQVESTVNAVIFHWLIMLPYEDDDSSKEENQNHQELKLAVQTFKTSGNQNSPKHSWCISTKHTLPLLYAKILFSTLPPKNILLHNM